MTLISRAQRCRRLRRREFLRRTLSAIPALFLLSPGPLSIMKRLDRSYVERSFYSMGSVATICAYGENHRHLQHALTRVIEEFQRLDGVLSVYHMRSELSKINAFAGKSEIAVGTEVLEIMGAARRYFELTAGAFDVTVEPLMKLWGFRENDDPKNQMPSDGNIRTTLEGVGMWQADVDLQRKTVGLKNPGSRLDFGGVAVGYALDRAVAMMKSEGIESAFINHSGDAYALGFPEDADGWSIVVPDPVDLRNPMAKFEIRDCAVSTSGNYEKYVTIEGARFGHILDPGTGYPANSLLSATVFASRAIDADALSTGCFSMGPEKAGAMISAIPGAGLLSLHALDGTTTLQEHGSLAKSHDLEFVKRISY